VDQRRLQKALAPYPVIWPPPNVCDEALHVFARFYLSHSLGIIDALIGQLAVSLDLTLHTFNQKHYAAIPRLQVVQPYSRD
jgi:predicted nucleic acid-binding protein